MAVTAERIAEIEAEIADWQQNQLNHLVAGGDGLASPVPKLTAEEREALTLALHQRIEKTFEHAAGGPKKYAKMKLQQAASQVARAEAARSLSVVQGTILEDHLQDAIWKHFPGADVDPDTVNRLFDPMKYGPLSTFSAKIDLAFALGIIGLSAKKALKTIAQIRNLFAHRLDVHEFEHPEVEALVSKLTYIDQALDHQEEGMVKVRLRNARSEVQAFIGFRTEDNPFKSARGRFERTCSFFEHHLRSAEPDIPEPDLHFL